MSEKHDWNSIVDEETIRRFFAKRSWFASHPPWYISPFPPEIIRAAREKTLSAKQIHDISIFIRGYDLARPVSGLTKQR